MLEADNTHCGLDTSDAEMSLAGRDVGPPPLSSLPLCTAHAETGKDRQEGRLTGSTLKGFWTALSEHQVTTETKHKRRETPEEKERFRRWMGLSDTSGKGTDLLLDAGGRQ